MYDTVVEGLSYRMHALSSQADKHTNREGSMPVAEACGPIELARNHCLSPAG